MSFRALLISLFLGLILLSTGLVTWVGVSGTGMAIRELVRGQINASLDSVSTQTQMLFNPSERILANLAAHLVDGNLPLEDPRELALEFGRLIAFERGVTWISFGYADGRFAGAYAAHGKNRINTSTPGGGAPSVWDIGEDGRLLNLRRETDVPDFDSRTRPWFELALRKAGLAWADPYDFAGGGRGITAARAVRGRDGALIGVFAVDFNLDDISTYLHRLEAQTRAETMVFLTDGSFLASSEPTPSSPVVLRIQSLLHDPAASHDLLDGEGRIIDEVVDGNESLLVGLRRTNLVGGLQCVSAIVFNRRETFGSIEEVLQNSAATASAAFILSMVVAFFVARRVSMPLRALTNEVRAIGSFKLESLKSPASSIHELKVLSTAVDRMRDSLKSFGHYVPVDIVKDLIRSGGVASLGGERRAVTVMFSDLEGFTKYAEKVTPEAAVETLTEYFEVFGRAIHNEGGVIDKFLGDGVMALFNAPTSVPAHARAACRAALQAKQALIARGGTYVPGTRIGLHVGEALVGNVGTYDRFSYTAIGDCVNLSSRLEGLNKIYGTAIIASDVLVKECGGDEFLWRHLDRVAVSGRDEPLDIYELMNFSEAAGDGQKRVAETHARALDLYLRGEFESAGRVFASISEVDSAASIMIERITVLLEAKPANWSGAFKASK